MELGERYMVKPSFAVTAQDFGKLRPMEGTVVYVHPKGRFATLEFDGIHGRFRECFGAKELRHPLPDKRRI